MKPSKVYFTDMRVHGENLPDKLIALARAAGIENIDFADKYVAIKVHFGEVGNLAFLRPDYARALVRLIRELGGKPFVTDCSTLYVGARKNALDHLDVTYAHGYNPLCLECHTIIADGLKGTDEALIPIDCEYVKTAKIGRAIADADIIISLNHFKGHEGTGFGGALKNLGMGCGSSAGKAEMHSTEKPAVDRSACVGCGVCESNCAHDAIHVLDGSAHVDYEKCKGCGRCIGVCPQGALHTGEAEGCAILARKISEYALAVVKDKPHFHLSLAIDISPFCDCYANTDASVVPDVGMFASFDPVAIDVACADLVNQQPPIANSRLGEREHEGDHFHTMHPVTNWRAATEHGEAIGLGSTQYELVVI